MLYKYKTKPVEVVAVQWDGSATGATEIIDWILDSGHTARYWCKDGCSGTEDNHYIVVPTLEGHKLACTGDFIVKNSGGNYFSVLAEEDFLAAFDFVDVV